MQDAALEALDAWRSAGVPRNAAAWLTVTARRRLVDRLRRERLGAQALAQLGAELDDSTHDDVRGDVRGDDPLEDERLCLLFTCCHPALASEAQVALLLNAVCGLEAPEIARAFLIADATLAQRLVRAKRKVREAGIPFRVPAPALLGTRLPNVLAAIYLVFNEGHAAARGRELVRADLCAEAVRLARLATALLEDEPEARGLLALLLLHDSRRAARTDANGALVPLEEQDRTLWDRVAIDEAVAHLERALRQKRLGPYQLQAAIAAVHAEARTAAATDWRQIVLLYGELLALDPSPVVALNRAVAVAMADGPDAGLRELAPVESAGELASYPYLQAVKADLLRRASRPREAAVAYERAIGLTRNETERAYLRARLEACLRE